MNTHQTIFMLATAIGAAVSSGCRADGSNVTAETDSGVADDTGTTNPTDLGAGSDTGATDAGALTDSGARTDTGPRTDSGPATSQRGARRGLPRGT